MKVIITGTTGYVGEGVLLSCLEMQRMSRLMYPVMRLIGQGNTIDEVAKAMIAYAEGKSDHTVITVKDVTQLAKK